jgi:hypothetical protein
MYVDGEEWDVYEVLMPIAEMLDVEAEEGTMIDVIESLGYAYCSR